MKKRLEKLMEVDRMFCEESQMKKEMAWSKYLSNKAIMGTSKHEPYIDGKSKIVNLISMIYRLENLSFTWTPEHAFVSKDNTLGVTTGKYTRKYVIDEEEFEEEGKYVTTWEMINNEWKIVFDMGN